jgi:transitional endoplasmic reticulum ATPase
MGHFSGSPSQTPAVSSNHASVYENFKSHGTASRVNTDLAVTVSIRSQHPNTHVTSITAHVCDLIGFARAGYLKADLQTEGDNFLAERRYAPPATRLEGGQGTLDDRVSFGYFDAEYQDAKFHFYMVRWRDEFFGRGVQQYYILSPKSGVDAAGHDPWVDKLLLHASKWTSELHDEIYVYDSGDWDKNTHLWKAVQNSSWDDVIMDPAMKETLISDVQNFFDSREVYEEYAVPWKRGIIFHGTPGCGKTISIKALMNALDKRETPVASLYVKTFTTSCPGEEYSIREIFQKARVMAPCMLVFEDLDSLVKDKIRSYFLNEVDGLEDNNGILMIGSTNHLDRLDPGISKRPSRFDRKYHFKIPGYNERVLYCEYWRRKLEKNPRINFEDGIEQVVAKMTDGFSFAYLKELFVQTLLAIVGGRADDIEEAEELKIVDESTRLVDGDGKVESSSGEKKEEEKVEESTDEKRKDEKKSKKVEMPKVEIPEHLKTNPLMRILQKQCAALWKDMDTANDPEAGVKKPKQGGDGEEEDEKKDCEGCAAAAAEKAEQMRLFRRHF